MSKVRTMLGVVIAGALAILGTSAIAACSPSLPDDSAAHPTPITTTRARTPAAVAPSKASDTDTSEQGRQLAAIRDELRSHGFQVVRIERFFPQATPPNTIATIRLPDCDASNIFEVLSNPIRIKARSDLELDQAPTAQQVREEHLCQVA